MKRYVARVRVLQALDGDEDLLEHLFELGAVSPRAEGYLPEEVDRILVAYTLARDLGVNWEGVEVALRLREELVATHRQVARLLHELQVLSRTKR